MKKSDNGARESYIRFKIRTKQVLKKISRHLLWFYDYFPCITPIHRIKILNPTRNWPRIALNLQRLRDLKDYQEDDSFYKYKSSIKGYAKIVHSIRGYDALPESGVVLFDKWYYFYDIYSRYNSADVLTMKYATQAELDEKGHNFKQQDNPPFTEKACGYEFDEHYGSKPNDDGTYSLITVYEGFYLPTNHKRKERLL